MNITNQRHPADDRSGRTPHDEDVPVRTRIWCTAAMIPLACLMNVVFTSLASQQCPADDPGYWWYVLALFVSMASGFVLLARAYHPEITWWIACALTVLFPFDPLLALMASSSLLARRSSRTVTIRTVAVTAIVTLVAQLKDVMNPPEASVWRLIFARPNTGGDSGVPMEMLAGEPTIIVTVVVISLIEVAIATLVGMHIRSRAILRAANAKTDEATTQAQSLRVDLDDQRLADAIAAEAHDTLAHSLSLIALNASALQAESDKLSDMTADESPAVQRQAHSIGEQARQIRKQAAGALDEAHSIIDMLRHPEQAHIHLAPDDDTALTRESLDSLLTDARLAGMAIDTWIDIRQLSDLDERIGKIAYRAVQEGLTNAQRHAPGARVALEVNADPHQGVHVHLSNPASVDGQASDMAATDGDRTAAHGAVAGDRAGVGSDPNAAGKSVTGDWATAVEPGDGAFDTAVTDASTFDGNSGSRRNSRSNGTDTISMPAQPTTPMPIHAYGQSYGAARSQSADTLGAGESTIDDEHAEHVATGQRAGRTGSGLPGLTARARSVGGTCTYGPDEHNIFHLDVVLPGAA